MLHCMQDQDEFLALSAAEFWRLLSDNTEICTTVVGNYLSQILPVLLTRFVIVAEDEAKVITE